MAQRIAAEVVVAMVDVVPAVGLLVLVVSLIASSYGVGYGR